MDNSALPKLRVTSYIFMRRSTNCSFRVRSHFLCLHHFLIVLFAVFFFRWRDWVDWLLYAMNALCALQTEGRPRDWVRTRFRQRMELVKWSEKKHFGAGNLPTEPLEGEPEKIRKVYFLRSAPFLNRTLYPPTLGSDDHCMLTKKDGLPSLQGRVLSNGMTGRDVSEGYD